MRTRIAAVSVGLAAILTFAACAPMTTGSGAGPLSPGAMSRDQELAIEDGTVTADEYQASFQRFRDCLSLAGYEVTLREEENSAIQYSIPAAAVDDGTEEGCYLAEFQQVDMAWQIAHQDTSESTQAMRDCLIEEGITPKETTEEIAEQIREAGIDMMTCAD